jgi:sulfur carrier protein ThiS
MEVAVKLFNQLRTYSPDRRFVFSIQLPRGASVGDLLEELDIPSTVARSMLLNGRRIDEKALLSPGDEVVLMSPIEGG